jgi:hypothetical protein
MFKMIQSKEGNQVKEREKGEKKVEEKKTLKE